MAGPYSNAHVVRVIKGNPEKYGSVSLTEQYLSQLRKGQRTAPSDETKRAVALFFGIPVGWLLGELDPAAARQVENEVQLLALALRDEGVKSIALRSFGLPSEMQNLVLGLLGQMRGQAGLPGDHEAED
ncbi:helix-turn-helix domain-containing protein [Streptacidiphilus sp. PAMC 29251]